MCSLHQIWSACNIKHEERRKKNWLDEDQLWHSSQSSVNLCPPFWVFFFREGGSGPFFTGNSKIVYWNIEKYGSKANLSPKICSNIWELVENEKLLRMQKVARNEKCWSKFQSRQKVAEQLVESHKLLHNAVFTLPNM